MTVVVQRDDRSLESTLGYLPSEDPSQEGALVQMSYGPGVPHLEWSSSYLDTQENLHLGSRFGLEVPIQLAGEIEYEPNSETWSIPVGDWGRDPLPSAHLRHNRGPEISDASYTFQDMSSLGSVQISIRASLCHSFTKVAGSEEEIMAAMRGYGLAAIADRLNHLRALIADDPDEPDLVLESLRSFADFFMHEDRLPVPEVGAGPEGFLEAEWRIPAEREAPAIAPSVRWVRPDDRYWGQGDGILAMKFLPSGSIQYAAVSGPVGRAKERLRSSGVYSKNSIMSAIQEFTSRLGLP